MGGKNKAPPPPDYGPIAEASEKAADQAFQIATEQLAWAKETYALDKELVDKVGASFLDSMEFTKKNAIADRARYEGTFQPIEDSFAKAAMEYDTPERRAAESGRAIADVGQQFDAARHNAVQSLESYGVNPSATRFAALDVGVRTQEGAAKAAASSQATRDVEKTGLALKSEAINIGKGYPGQIAQSFNTAQNAGNSTVGNRLNSTQVGGQTMGTAPQYQQIGGQALDVWGNTLTQGYNAQLAQFNANQNSSSGIGGLIGAALGFKFEDGGMVPDYEEGGPVAPAQSPSRGAIPDDVRANLTANEFVVPAETVKWVGEKFMQGLIEKSAKEKQETLQRTGAIPVPGGSPPQQAIPMGA